MKPTLMKIAKQNETIISLLGRTVFPEDALKKIITTGSKKPKSIIKAYNLCDGSTNITDIAKKASIAQPSLTKAVNKWEEIGIVTKHFNENKTIVFPQRLYKIKEV